ncbi:hypothetical protein AALC75_20790 [Lachnospiraceae bacterium 48-42]
MKMYKKFALLFLVTSILNVLLIAATLLRIVAFKYQTIVIIALTVVSYAGGVFIAMVAISRENK